MSDDSPQLIAVADGPPAPVGPGTRFGKYEIMRHLATGGMAEIYLARVTGIPGFQKAVVIKRIRPELAGKRDFVEMFLDEARIAATLEHPNVVQTYDVGVVDGNYFISMEYLHGEILSAMMRKVVGAGKKVPIEHTLAIGIGLAQGLHYAHDKVGFDGAPLQIIHRDVTPQNVILTYEGGVKLLDFGIAKATNKVSETRSGTLKGKLAYMSPEQCRGEPLDRRSDVFSLGIVLWEMAVCRRLFRGSGDFSIMKQIVEGRVPRPSEVNPETPPALEAIILRALEKDREHRFSTARELAQALEAYAREERVFVSQSGMQTFMEEVFGHKIEAWREAQARGMSLADHLEEAKSDQLPAAVDDGSSEVAGWSGAGSSEASAVGTRNERSGSRERGAPEDGDSAARRSSLPAIAAAVGGLGLLLASWVYLRTHHAAEPPTVVMASVATPAAPLQPPSAPVVAAPRATLLRVMTQPAGATVSVDGKPLAQLTPSVLEALASDQEHALVVTLAGYRDEERRFTLQPGETRSIELSLAREAHHHHGVAATDTQHRGGAVQGVSGNVESPSAPGSAAPSPSFAIVSDKPTPTGDGTLVVSTTPWCNVSVDGVAKGPTPLSMKLPAGPHSVVLTNPEFKIQRTISVQVVPGQTLKKKLDFN